MAIRLGSNKFRFVVGQLSVALLLVTVGPRAFASEPSGGLEQSPIDITENILDEDDDLPLFQTLYSSNTSLRVLNNGSPDHETTIKASVPAGAASLSLSGKTYNLMQFHWHTPSEHQLDGNATVMEMHLVHQKTGSTGFDDLLVIGVFIVEGKEHKELDKIFAHLPEHPGDVNSVASFNLNKLLPANRDNYRYDGSLTTPPFTEGVQWIVIDKPIELSATQIHDFQHLFYHGNIRPPQPINGRTVLTDVDD